jgi:hypothetical protein
MYVCRYICVHPATQPPTHTHTHTHTRTHTQLLLNGSPKVLASPSERTEVMSQDSMHCGMSTATESPRTTKEGGGGGDFNRQLQAVPTLHEDSVSLLFVCVRVWFSVMCMAARGECCNVRVRSICIDFCTMTSYKHAFINTHTRKYKQYVQVSDYDAHSTFSVPAAPARANNHGRAHGDVNTKIAALEVR